ncbi:hypothetical protein BKA66DRAFT_371535, partial [Pyrenochaeta sp. MPI-SDFR-AT-0127]
MSKRNSDGDVIANQLSLIEAKGQKFLASLLGPQPQSTPASGTSQDAKEDEDLKEDFGHDRLGVGGILPKDVADGSFTRRIPTSNDKLLEQLIGKKKAKAHLAAKEAAARPNAKAQGYGRPTVKKEESEDEEEGRAAAFKSKKRKANVKAAVAADVDDSGDEDEETRAARLASNGNAEPKEKVAIAALEVNNDKSGTDEEVEAPPVSKKLPSRGRTKPTSFLDEILAERSKKKKNKGK